MSTGVIECHRSFNLDDCALRPSSVCDGVSGVHYRRGERLEPKVSALQTFCMLEM